MRAARQLVNGSGIRSEGIPTLELWAHSSFLLCPMMKVRRCVLPLTHRGPGGEAHPCDVFLIRTDQILQTAAAVRLVELLWRSAHVFVQRHLRDSKHRDPAIVQLFLLRRTWSWRCQNLPREFQEPYG